MSPAHADEVMPPYYFHNTPLSTQHIIKCYSCLRLRFVLWVLRHHTSTCRSGLQVGACVLKIRLRLSFHHRSREKCRKRLERLLA
ncbi:hypothetical protein J6590_017712 [Homalodisca vitripennis]|nr:hypothetical protein J6590_017712 [Homalodisca vitripennis]